MKLKIITMLAAALAVAAFLPTARACEGGGNNANADGHHRHHQDNGQAQAGAGEGLNNGVNLSLDQKQQGHNGNHGKMWEHKKHEHNNG